MAVTRQQVAELYVATFNRAPDAAGLDYWVNDSGLTIEQIAQSFFDQPETQTLYPTGTTNSAFVTSIYTNLFNRTPDAAGLAYWEAELTSGNMTRSVMIEAMKNGALGSDATIITNKATVGLAYAAAGLEGTTFSLASVTADAATVSAALNDIADLSNPGSAFALTTTAGDVIVGTAGNDTITATTTTDDATDMIIDASSTDTDTLNWAVTTNPVALTVTKIENVNVNTQTAAAVTVDATNFSGVENLTVTREDLAGGLIDGTGAVTVNPVDAADVAKITAGTQVNALTVTQATTAGITVDASTVTGNVTVTGAATVLANASTGTVSITAGLGNTTQDAKAISIDAAAATNVTTAAAMTGAITINAAVAAQLTVNNATGGVVINAATAAETVTNATGIVVTNVDASGATITTGTYASATAGDIAIDGTAATTDVATISAAGFITLDTHSTGQAVDIINLSGNGAAVTYTIDAGATIATLTATGTNTVNVKMAADDLDAITVSGVATLTANAAATGAVDLTNVSATTIDMTADMGGNDFTVATGSRIKLSADQATDLDLIAATDNAALTLVVGDDTTTTAQATITVNALDLNDTNDWATIAIVAEDGRLTATGFDAADATVTITGDENVTLGTTVLAGSINASNLTGVLSMTMDANSTTVTSGSAADTITMNGAAVMTLDAGNGANVITVTSVSNGSTVVTGTGNDNFTLTSTASYVIQGGSGNDTYTVSAAADIDAVIADSDGTDSIVFGAGAINFSDNTNFAFSGIETLNITAANAAITMASADLTGKTLTVTGDAAADILLAAGTDTAADTIDFSAITTSGTATLKIDGGDKADIMTGSNSGTTFIINDGDVDSGETITGGTGTDILDGSGLTAAIDLTVATITGIDTLYTNLMSATLGQGTGITAIANDSATAFGTKASAVILAKSTTSFESAAEANAAAVNIAGEWYLTQDANADTTLGDNALTYFDEVRGEAVTVTLTGVAATNVATGAVVAGNLVIDIA